jgi:hypothetical protein
MPPNSGGPEEREDHEHEVRSRAHTEGIAYLVRSGLIEMDAEHEGYHVTDRGRVHVEALLRVPLPEWRCPVTGLNANAEEAGR